MMRIANTMNQQEILLACQEWMERNGQGKVLEGTFQDTNTAKAILTGLELVCRMEVVPRSPSTGASPALQPFK